MNAGTDALDPALSRKMTQEMVSTSQADVELPEHFRLELDPVADPKAIVRVGNARFTVLTSRLIRIEYSDQRLFEDRASQAVWFRKQPVPRFEVKKGESVVEIITDHLHLTWHISEKDFSKDTLQICLLKTEKLWHFGDNDRANLGGTVRTLDGKNGAVPLPPGLMSRNGWSVINDSKTLVFDDRFWLVPRGNAAEGSFSTCSDTYFFGYGNDYLGCLKDFCRIAGKMPLVPRYVLGNWWSRYKEYSQDELIGLMKDFREHQIPLSVCIVDMDWHIVKNEYHRGWTGTTWNKDLFPDPEAFTRFLHDQGLRTALNLHPRDGVHPHEDAYKAFAEHMGIDASSKTPIEFDIADPKFARGYFEFVHHPHEKAGIDFWWMDWQQGAKSKVDGLDPLWWLNHLHYHDLGRDGSRRPFIFSRWGEWGNHRYPIGFSGDTHVTWESLAFQPYFTSTAANVGYCFWSHDIGGHFHGTEDPELYMRWIQFGVFSPVLRLHSSKNRFQDRRPWAYGDENFRIARDYMQLRHALIPYIYTMYQKTCTECIPLVRPMYYDHPSCEEAYRYAGQYYFGTELLVAPFVNPVDRDTSFARIPVWLPRGDWYNFFTGEYLAGDRCLSIYGQLDEVPVFARAGAIVPTGPKTGWGNIDNPDTLAVHVFAGADHTFELYEDDGETVAYRDGKCCITRISQVWTETSMIVRVEPAQGDLSLIPKERTWNFVVSGITASASVTCTSDGVERRCSVAYDEIHEKLTIDIDGIVRAGSSLEITISSCDPLLSRRNRLKEQCEWMLREFRAPTREKGTAAQVLNEIFANTANLAKLAGVLTAPQFRALAEIILEARNTNIPAVTR